MDNTVGTDPLELWMSSGVIDCKDPVMWWSSQLDSKVSMVDPALARMAIDLLSAPGMFYFDFGLGIGITIRLLGFSSEMEQGFSRGGLMVSPHCQNLKGASVRMGTVLFSWHEIPGLIPERDLVKLFNEKSSRKVITVG